MATTRRFRRIPMIVAHEFTEELVAAGFAEARYFRSRRHEKFAAAIDLGRDYGNRLRVWVTDEWIEVWHHTGPRAGDHWGDRYPLVDPRVFEKVTAALRERTSL